MIDEKYKYDVEDLIKRYPELSACKNDIIAAFELLCECFSNGHKLLVAGNGGSCADSEHIVGELMKGFKKKRPLKEELCEKIKTIDSELGKNLIVTGISPKDDIIEVIEFKDYPNFFLGVQWHPEFTFTDEDKLIFKCFCKNL